MIELHDRIKNKKIALYGLGTETERLINEWNRKYQIVGLLDSFKAEGEQFGYPIMPIQDVVKLDDVVIIVVARPGSCKAIAKKSEVYAKRIMYNYMMFEGMIFLRRKELYMILKM